MDIASPAGADPGGARGFSPDAPAFVTAAGRRLEYYWTRRPMAGETALVLLHEGLGSAGLWRDFPARLSVATGLPALVYSRYGYGFSEVLQETRGIDYMHREALDALPALRAAFGLDEVILIGHSDGGSIALIHAGAPGIGGRWPVLGLILEAPHVFVEDRTVAGIEAARDAWETTDFPARFARRHADGERTFRGWNDIWLDPAYRAWNIEEYLPGVACPVLVIQGEEDDYGTVAQVEAIAGQVAGPSETLMLPDCGHAPHRDQEAVVLDAMAAFVARLC